MRLFSRRKNKDNNKNKNKNRSYQKPKHSHVRNIMSNIEKEGKKECSKDAGNTKFHCFSTRLDRIHIDLILLKDDLLLRLFGSRGILDKQTSICVGLDLAVEGSLFGRHDCNNLVCLAS